MNEFLEGLLIDQEREALGVRVLIKIIKEASLSEDERDAVLSILDRNSLNKPKTS